ncbi:hypothetical protein AMIS_20560 [Actinoplanes missouriensis 431]|uniref:Uncharacterized protein n=1 Tax=Actinoplanes missouriensis (strain ATCC 14538 / DSM 43046 / CBS 188.64 / JCM 3121 / NBRC 102363 / NCIMB 12654 / NRRL B-3342 / UNCC 431) TaxID=512565 RepID=I0H2N9_ACTM4|nr:hypothetical protein [Actinoplanes missouriensis]BAL87276.1 hypothetical protein AMIS_20560 [Actinoplanes missouriensis 431]
MTRTPDDHPAWCLRDEVDAILPRHRSAIVRVGSARPGVLSDRVQVTVRLTATAHGPAWVSVNCAHMTGVTVDISLADAAALRDGLTRLLQAAEHK